MNRPALIAIAAAIVAAVIIVTAARVVGPPVSRTLLRWAARRCFDTDEQRERFAEEWLADLDDVPGALAKLAHTTGVLLLAAAPIWARSRWRRSRLARRLDRAGARPGPGLAGTGAGGAVVLAHAGAVVLAVAVTGLIAVPSVASTLRLFQARTAPSAAPAITGLLNPHGPVPGSLTCPTATTCYDQVQQAVRAGRGGVAGFPAFGFPAFGGLYASTDGARTWQDIPLPGGFTLTSVLACQSAQVCSAGAEDRGRPAFTITRDGGRTWTTSPIPAAAGVITSLSCPAATTCRALAATPTPKRFGQRVVNMLTTDHLLATDDGRHFTTTSFPAAMRAWLTCPTASHCVAVGAGPVLVSDDGGGTWHPGMLPRGVRSWGSLGCVDARHCFQVGLRMKQDDSAVLVSGDGGATWQLRALPARYPHPGINSLACVSVGICYVSGWDDAPQSFENGNATSGSTPIAAITQDAGLTWQPIGLPGPSSLPLPAGEPPDAFMSLSLQCPTASTCISLADDVSGYKHAAIYTTTARGLVTAGGASGWAIAGSLFGDLATVLVGLGLARMLRRRLQRHRETASVTATAGPG